jgi:DNA-binding transcriptional ArsR family regulator
VVELMLGSGVTQGAISQHLKALKRAGLVVERPQAETSIDGLNSKVWHRWSTGRTG